MNYLYGVALILIGSEVLHWATEFANFNSLLWYVGTVVLTFGGFLIGRATMT